MEPFAIFKHPEFKSLHPDHLCTIYWKKKKNQLKTLSLTFIYDHLNPILNHKDHENIILVSIKRFAMCTTLNEGVWGRKSEKRVIGWEGGKGIREIIETMN